MKLDRYTILHRKDERGAIVESGVFGPDDEVPQGFEVGADYARPADTMLPQGPPVLIDNSRVTTGEVRSTQTVDEILDQAPDEAAAGEVSASETPDEDDDEGPEPPPQGGAGSGVDAWRAYAAEVDVEVAESATRDDIIDAVQKAGYPV